MVSGFFRLHLIELARQTFDDFIYAAEKIKDIVIIHEWNPRNYVFLVPFVGTTTPYQLKYEET